MAADAEEFAQAAFLAVLVGDGGHDFAAVQRVVVQAERVDARHLHVAVLLHEAALVLHVDCGRILAVVVARPDHAVGGAVVADLFGEGPFEARGQRAVVIEPHPAPVADGVE